MSVFRPSHSLKLEKNRPVWTWVHSCLIITLLFPVIYFCDILLFGRVSAITLSTLFLQISLLLTLFPRHHEHKRPLLLIGYKSVVVLALIGPIHLVFSPINKARTTACTNIMFFIIVVCLFCFWEIAYCTFKVNLWSKKKKILSLVTMRILNEYLNG